MVSPIEHGTLTLPEEVQLMLRLDESRLAFGWIELAAAALIDLALSGRVEMLPATGLFRGIGDRKVAVVDPSPTGSPALDSALAVLSGHGKPWIVSRCMIPVGREVSPAVHSELQLNGIARVVGKFPDLAGHLVVEDPDAQAQVKSRVDRARLAPQEVSDPRLGALVDVLRNSDDRFRGETGLQPTIRWEWYPKEVTETVNAILWAEGYLAKPQ